MSKEIKDNKKNVTEEKSKVIKTDKEDDITIPVFASEEVKKVNFFKSLFMSFNYMIWGDV